MSLTVYFILYFQAGDALHQERNKDESWSGTVPAIVMAASAVVMVTAAVVMGIMQRRRVSKSNKTERII